MIDMTLFPCIILIYFVVGYGIETNAQVIHRYPYYCIPKQCSKNHYFVLCNSTNSAKPGNDECIPCDNGTFNLNKVDTSTLTYHLQLPEYEVCKKPDCNCGPEGFIVNGHNCSINGAQKICICNVNEGYCGDDYRKCDKWNKAESDIPVDWGLTQNSLNIHGKGICIWCKKSAFLVLRGFQWWCSRHGQCVLLVLGDLGQHQEV